MLVSVRALFLTPEWSIAWALISMKRLAAHHAVWGVEGYLKVSQRPVQWRSARESAEGTSKGTGAAVAPRGAARTSIVPTQRRTRVPCCCWRPRSPGVKRL
jgi:hypothetical protein